MEEETIVESLESGDVRVQQRYFDGDDYQTLDRIFTVQGAYVYQVWPNGAMEQTCEGLLPRGPTLCAGEDLAAVIRRTLGLK